MYARAGEPKNSSRSKASVITRSTRGRPFARS
jgi:hypothetical protein